MLAFNAPPQWLNPAAVAAVEAGVGSAQLAGRDLAARCRGTEQGTPETGGCPGGGQDAGGGAAPAQEPNLA